MIWDYVVRDGKQTKQPLNPNVKGALASSTDPEKWGNFEDALRADAGRGRIGFVFAGEFFGIDLDKCRDPETGEIEPWAIAIVERFPDANWSVSPSGTGLHGIGRGSLPPGRRRTGRIEVYDSGRYFSMTGDNLPGYERIGDDCTEELAAWHGETFPRSTPSAESGSQRAVGGASRDDAEILDRIRSSKQGPLFESLHDRGDTSGHGDDDSAADLAEMNILRFWTSGDPVRMERLFGQSALAQREKWKNRPDYRKLTIDRAIDGGKVYEPGSTLRVSGQSVDSEDDADTIEGLALGLGMRRSTFGTIKRDDEGIRYTAITNFIARIVNDVTKENGAESARHYDIEAVHQNGEVRRITVPAAEFPGLAWVPTELGPEWILNAGTSVKDKARQAVQLYSVKQGFESRRVYQHAGWTQVGDQWHYLAGNGAIGPNGLHQELATELPGKLALVEVFEPIRGDALRPYALAQLRILDAGPLDIVAPLFASAPVAILGQMRPVDFVVHLHGATGTFKTELAAIGQRHWGPLFNRMNTVATWHSTPNSLELYAFLAAHMLCLIDDLMPEGTSTDQARIRGAYQRIARSAGNGAGRSRMNADGSLKPDYFPRGLILSTGEDVPGGHSATGRTLTLEVSPGDISPVMLTGLQAAGDEGAFARVTSSFIHLVACRWEEVRAAYLDMVRSHTAHFRALPLAHSRHPETLGTLLAAATVWLDGLESLGAITREERTVALAKCCAGIEQAGTAQSDVIREANPVDQFLRMVTSAIASGDAHLADPSDNGQPSNSTVLGWRMQMVRVGDQLEPDYRPLGTRIGWADERGIFLLPDAALAVANTLGKSQGVAVPWGAKTLGKRLFESGRLLTAEAGRNTQKIRVAGSFQRVWHFAIGTIVEEVSPTPASSEDGNIRAFGTRKESA